MNNNKAWKRKSVEQAILTDRTGQTTLIKSRMCN